MQIFFTHLPNIQKILGKYSANIGKILGKYWENMDKYCANNGQIVHKYSANNMQLTGLYWANIRHILKKILDKYCEKILGKYFVNFVQILG